MYHGNEEEDDTISTENAFLQQHQSTKTLEKKNSIYSRLVGSKLQDVVLKMDESQRERVKTLRKTIKSSAAAKSGTCPLEDTDFSDKNNWKEEAENEFYAFILF